MPGYVARRLLSAIPVLFLVTLLSFGIMQIVPGDPAVMTLALLGVSFPSFWLGLMLIVVFAVQLDWLPSGGYVPMTESLRGWLRSATLPAISLALLQVGLLARITRATMLDVLDQDY